MDINRARQQLLNRFPQRYRQHILDFANNLSSIDADVLIFTARKAACFFHCLEHLRLWTPGSRLVTTDRLLDHDAGWIRGKKVAVIDEVIVSGSSLFRLHAALQVAQAAQVTIHALFVNKEWFVGEFFAEGTLANSYIELPGPDAQALGSTIVRAFQCLPRPYSIDYPMSGWVTLSSHHVDAITCIPDWTFSIADAQWGMRDGTASVEELEFFRFEPSRDTQTALCHRIDIDPRDVALLKVRTYGRWEVSGDRRTYHFRIVPYVILEERSTSEVEAIFSKLISTLDDVSRDELERSCRTGKSRLRVIQYVLSARLGRVWSGDCSEIGLRIPFVEDQRELSFVFPGTVAVRLAKLSDLVGAETTRQVRPGLQRGESDGDEFGATSQSLSADQYLSLTGIFLGLYLNEEIPERIRARKEGIAYFQNVESSGRGDRLTRGKTLLEIRHSMAAVGLEISARQLSMFIDLGVDSGVIVPITVTRVSASGQPTLTRAYRHGEETYIVLRDLALFHAMLSTIAEEVSRVFTENQVAAKSFGQHRLGRIVAEKALVLFVRFAIEQGIFPRVYADADDRGADAQLIGVGYDMFGARVAIGDHKPTHLPTGNTFVSWLCKQDVLLVDGHDGYIVNSGWANPYGVPDAAHLTNATRFAAVLASAVGSVVQRTKAADTEQKAVMKAVDRTLVTITTCESEASTLKALGAELRRFDVELFGLGVSRGATLDIRSLVTAERFVKAVLSAMNSGYLKIAAFVRDEAARNARALSTDIAKRDRVYAGLWDDIWRAVSREQSGGAREPLLRHLRGAVSVLLRALLLVHYVRAAALAKGGASDETVKLADAALKAKLRQLAKLAVEARATQSACTVDLAQAMDEALDWFQKTSSAAPQRLSNLGNWAMNEMGRLRIRAREQYEWIDDVTADDGRIARLKEYDSILAIRTDITSETWQFRYAKDFAEIVTATINRFFRSNSGPRAYSQGSRATSGDHGDFYVPGAREFGGKMVISLLAEGRRGASWLGYVQASLMKLLTKANPDGPQYVSCVALLGLEDARRIYRNLDNGGFISPVTSKALMRVGHERNVETGTHYAVIVDGAAKEEYGSAFVKEASEALRRKLARKVLEDVIVPEAGGTFAIENLADGEPVVSAAPTTDVAWVLVVEDELSAVLKFLEQSGLEVSTSIRTDGIIVGEALISDEKGPIRLRIFISLRQGNTSIGNLLTNICTTENRAFKFIVVSGICCSFGGEESLRKVVLPVSVLDMQIWRKSNEGRTPRSEGQAMPMGAVQLIRWYLAIRDRKANPEIEISDNVTMVSDNDLLRVDGLTEEHRALASKYSDKAVAYDMETAGVANWAYQNPQLTTTVVIKGMSDLGMANKSDDENRLIAARNAIAVSLDFIRISSRHESPSGGRAS